jgi:hypothetical protein
MNETICFGHIHFFLVMIKYVAGFLFCFRVFQLFFLFEVLHQRKQIFLFTLKMSHKKSVAAFLLRDFFI